MQEASDPSQHTPAQKAQKEKDETFLVHLSDIYASTILPCIVQQKLGNNASEYHMPIWTTDEMECLRKCIAYSSDKMANTVHVQVVSLDTVDFSKINQSL